MEQGEVLRLESAGFQQNHGEGIAKHQHHRAAAGGSQIQRTGFALHGGIQENIRRLRKAALEPARKSDELTGQSFEMRQEAQDFIGLPAVAEGDNNISSGDEAEVSMQRVLSIQNNGGSAGTIEGSGDFGSDVAGFSDAANDDFPAALQVAAQQFHGVDK